MLKPVCCARNGTPYRKSYRLGECWEEGFRCKTCGAVRLWYPIDSSSYMATLEPIQLAGILFDEELSIPNGIQGL